MEKDNAVSSNRRKAQDAATIQQPPVVVNIPAHRMLYDMNDVLFSFFTKVSDMTSQPPIPQSVMQETMAFLINPLAKSKELRTSFVQPTVVVPAIKSASSAFSVYQQKSQEQIPAVRQEISEKTVEKSSQLPASIASSSTTVTPAMNNTFSAFKVYQRPNLTGPAAHQDIFGNFQATAGNHSRNAGDHFQTRQEEGPSTPKRQRME